MDIFDFHLQILFRLCSTKTVLRDSLITLFTEDNGLLCTPFRVRLPPPFHSGIKRLKIISIKYKELCKELHNI